MPRTVELSVPPDTTERVIDAVEKSGGALTVSVQRGASVVPSGDVVTVRLTNEGARRLIGELRARNLYGSVSVTTTEVASVAQASAEHPLRAEAAESTWSEIAFFIRHESNPTFNFLVFMLLAGSIATVGLWKDAPPVVIGAMVLAPALVPLLRIPFGLVGGDTTMALRGVVSTLAGYAAVAIGAVVTTLVLGVVDPLPWEEFRAQQWVQFWSTLTPSAVVIAVVAAAASAFAVSNRGVIPLTGVLIALDLVPATSMAGMGMVAGDFGFAVQNVGRASVDMSIVLLVGGAMLGFERAMRHRYDTEPRE
jgi:uncharacterized hydrophobic protein (TIGR00271 family)